MPSSLSCPRRPLPAGALPGQVNTLVDAFLDRRLGMPAPGRRAGGSAEARQAALYLSSPIGLGQGRRDLAIARELRKLHPDLQVDWLAQDPVTGLLAASGSASTP